MDIYKLRVVGFSDPTTVKNEIRLVKTYYFENRHDMDEYANMLEIKRNWRINDCPERPYGRIRYEKSHLKCTSIELNQTLIVEYKDKSVPTTIKLVNSGEFSKTCKPIIRNEVFVESEILNKFKDIDVIYDGYYKDYVRIFNITENSDGTITIMAETGDGFIECINNHVLSLLKPEKKQIVGGPAVYE